VIRAILIASGAKIEPAFNALLAMTDPDSHQEEPAPPPKPPRPTRSPLPATSTPANQLEADEIYARQLAEHYSAPSYRGTQQRSQRDEPSIPRPRPETGLKPNELYDKDHSFIEDDLPVIKENILQGFMQTQTKVNQWVETLRKKFDGEDSLYEPPTASSQANRDNSNRYKQSASYNSQPPAGSARRNVDRARYDADPRVLDDDFAGLELRDETHDHPRKFN
jgi:hypothetical protein